jgi:hypothetical protein
MVLVPCKECGREISDQAAACPHCGAPIGVLPVVPGPTPTPTVITHATPEPKSYKFQRIAFGVLAIAIIVVLVKPKRSTTDASSPSNFSSPQPAQLGLVEGEGMAQWRVQQAARDSLSDLARAEVAARMPTLSTDLRNLVTQKRWADARVLIDSIATLQLDSLGDSTWSALRNEVLAHEQRSAQLDQTHASTWKEWNAGRSKANQSLGTLDGAQYALIGCRVWNHGMSTLDRNRASQRILGFLRERDGRPQPTAPMANTLASGITAVCVSDPPDDYTNIFEIGTMLYNLSPTTLDNPLQQ